MKDTSARHVVADMSHAARVWSKENGRSVILIAETNVYDPLMIAPRPVHRIGADGNENDGIGFDAQWCDDFLHSVFAVLRPGEQLCHRSYQSGKDLDQTLKFGYVFEGTLREDRGRPNVDSRVDTRGLIYSIQHHDFIGNHPLGKRLHQLTSLETQRAAAALLILSPAIPMFFMGEEFACERPFQFFVDFGDERLRQSVVEGRRREYPQHDWSSGTEPIDQAAFDESKIGSVADGNPEMREWYKELISLRKQYRGQGVLVDEHLHVETIPEHSFYSMCYRTSDVELTIAVRLVASGDDSDFEYDVTDGDSQLLSDSRSETSDFKTFRGSHAKVFVKHAT
jgi:1,4-alpha-glucan branching enzyme